MYHTKVKGQLNNEKKGKKGGEERKQAREKSPREEPPSKTMKGGEERKSGGKNEDFQPVAFPSQTMGGLDPVLWGPLCCHNKGFLTGLGGVAMPIEERY